ncbi:MAG: ABC transporter substrate-binding protein [Spirochaetia bacterium]|nr:ABC transporter substrate-binding protein [Spirochaetia bacterium]
MKKGTKSIVPYTLLLLTAVLVVGIAFTGCAKEEEPKVEAEPVTEAAAPEVTVEEVAPIAIGFSKIIQHPALDAVEQGVMDVFEEEGIEATFDMQNANGDIPTAASIAQKFKADKVDFAVGIATPTAQALANLITDVPVIYAAVTDPVAAGLVESFDKGLGNVTGVSDMTPVEAQVKMLKDIAGVTRLGHIYTSGEANAVLLADMTKAACEKLGIEFIPSAVTNTSEVRQATQAIVNKVDGIYVSTDNTVVSAMPSLVEIADLNDIPVLTADPTSSAAVGIDVLVAWGFDYYKMGRATGYLIQDIINGADPADIGTVFMTKPTDIELWINLDIAKRLGITVPADIIDGATVIIENGVKR